MRGDEKTIQSIFNVWFWNFQNHSIQQYSNLYLATVSILLFFNEDGKYEDDLKELKNIYFHPIIDFREKYPDLKVTENPIDWDISKIEWCYYRDTQFKSKLLTEYFIDAKKAQEKKKLVLGEIITVLSLFKQEMFSKIVKILIENKLQIYITLPTGQGEIQQLRGDDVV